MEEPAVAFSVEDEIESILFIAREVSVYKIPPRTSNAGYKAQEWGDLAAPLWKGRMRIIEKSSGVTICLEDPTNGDMFAQAPYTSTSPSVEAVLDSSRYFVLRVEDQGRKAYIGIGFAERPEAFDFNVALQDYDKRQAALQSTSTVPENAKSPHLPAEKKDYSLKDGQTFSISIPGKTNVLKTTGSTAGSSGGAASGSGGVPLLPPPPSAPKRR